MNAALAWVARDTDWSRFGLFLIFILIPLGLRFLKWLAEQAGLVEADTTDAERKAQRKAAHDAELERRRRLREELARKESEGGETWRRLARGESTAAPKRPAPVPARADDEEDDEEEEEEEDGEDGSETRAAPLVALEALVPTASPERSVPLAQAKAAALDIASAPMTLGAARVRLQLGFAPEDLRRAIVLAEILGQPVSLRG